MSGALVLLGLWLAAAGQAPAAPAQAPAETRGPAEIRGSWSATAGSQVFTGTWTGSTQAKTPDQAQGTWGLLEGRRVVLRGTWAATRTARGWRGTWSARVGTADPAAPPAYAGSWQAEIPDASLETLADMLARTLQEDVLGTWRAGGRSGAWRLAAGRR